MNPSRAYQKLKARFRLTMMYLLIKSIIRSKNQRLSRLFTCLLKFQKKWFISFQSRKKVRLAKSRLMTAATTSHVVLNQTQNRLQPHQLVQADTTKAGTTLTSKTNPPLTGPASINPWPRTPKTDLCMTNLLAPQLLSKLANNNFKKIRMITPSILKIQKIHNILRLKTKTRIANKCKKIWVSQRPNWCKISLKDSRSALVVRTSKKKVLMKLRMTWFQVTMKMKVEKFLIVYSRKQKLQSLRE